MVLDRDLVAQIRRAAPSPADLTELLAAVLLNYDAAQRRQVLAELEQSGIFGPPDDLSHSVRAESAMGLRARRRDVPPERKDWVLRQLRGRSSSEPLIDVETTNVVQRDFWAQMVRTNRLVTVVDDERQLLPAFQFDLMVSDLVPRFSVQRANLILRAGDDPWGALSWWTSPNGWLGGSSPADLVGTDDEGTVPVLAESLLSNAG